MRGTPGAIFRPGGPGALRTSSLAVDMEVSVFERESCCVYDTCDVFVSVLLLCRVTVVVDARRITRRQRM